MWQSTPLTLPLVLTGLGLLACALFVWTRRPQPRAAREFVAVALAIATHTLGYAFEFASTSLARKLLCFDLQMVGIAAIPVVTVAFASAYQGRPLNARALGWLSVIPLLTLLLAWTSGLHELLLTDTHLVDGGGYVLRHSGSGPLWWVFLAFTYGCVTWTALSYLVAWIRGSRVHRRQARALFFGLLAPYVANVVFHIRGGSQIDTTPFAYAVTIVGWTWALTRHGLLELSPIAYDMVLERMDQAVLVLDARGRVLEANRAARALLGVTELSTGATPSAILAGRHPQLLAHLEAGTACVELPFDERFYTLETRPIESDHDTRVEGTLVVLRDTTAQRETEDAREAALAAAREATRLRSALLAQTSHEVRTPLQGILGSAELLAETALDPSQRRWVDAILGSGRSLLTVVNDVLDLERARSGQLERRETVFAPAELVESVLHLFEGAARRRTLTLRSSVGGAVPPHVSGDPERLRQLLGNLVGNAVKHADPGAVIVQVDVAQGWAQHALCFTVEDAGPGIDEGTLGHLFAPFRPGAHSQGSGLGLSLTKQLAQALGGELAVRVVGSVATRDRRTRACLTLPLATAAAPADDVEEAVDPASRARALRVLVVEDRPDIAAIIEASLLADGHQPTLTADGAGALELFEPGRFELVLMDLQLPDTDGLTLARALRGRQPDAEQLSATPIVAMSASGALRDAGELQSAGIADTLHKPFTRAELRRLLARVTRTPLSDEGSRTLPQGRAWEAFAAAAPSDLRALREAASRRDHQAIRRVAHSLEGASLFLGAQDIAAHCVALRSLGAEDSGWDQVDALAQALAALLRTRTECYAADACSPVPPYCES